MLSPATSGAERRQHPRFSRSGTVVIYPYTPSGAVGKPLQVQIRDISADGIGLIHVSRIEPGAQFVISLEQPGQEPAIILYKCAVCRPAAAEGFQIGATVVQIVHEEKLLADDSCASGLARFARLRRLRRNEAAGIFPGT